MHPDLSFLQIKKNNDEAVLLAPIYLWRRQKCFAVAELIAIQSKDLNLVVNGNRTSAEEGGLVFTTFLPFLMKNYVICSRAPPRPLRRQMRFSAVELITTQSKGSRPVVNDERSSAKENGLVCTTFSSLLMRNYVICSHARAPSPMAAAEALCSGGTHHHSIKGAKANCERKDSRWRRG